LDKASIRTDGLFLNADAGFDCDVLRDCLDRNGVVANICISRRRTETDHILSMRNYMLNNTPSRGQTLGWIATELFSIDLIRPFQVGNLGIISHSPYCFLRKFHEKEKFKSLL
jgi:hypothetical protein